MYKCTNLGMINFYINSVLKAYLNIKNDLSMSNKQEVHYFFYLPRKRFFELERMPCLVLILFFGSLMLNILLGIMLFMVFFVWIFYQNILEEEIKNQFPVETFTEFQTAIIEDKDSIEQYEAQAVNKDYLYCLWVKHPLTQESVRFEMFELSHARYYPNEVKLYDTAQKGDKVEVRLNPYFKEALCLALYL